MRPLRLPSTTTPCQGPRRGALARCAGTLIAALLAGLFAGCDKDGAVAGAGEADGGGPGAPGGDVLEVGADGVQRDDVGIPVDAPVPEEARQKVRELVEAMIRPPLDETSDLHDQWFHRTRTMLGKLMEEEESVGHAALHAFTGDVSDGTVTRRALLMIGTRCSPQAAAPLLRELMLNYGYRLDDRAEATLLLAEAAPETYLADAAPYLQRRERPTKTMPPDEFLMRGWIVACERSGNSPVEMCADVSTNLAMEPMARYIAAEELGRHPHSRLARQALETCLIESTGDGYLRRKAAQAIQASYSAEDACALFQDVLSKEADINFAGFLYDVVQRLACR